MSLHTAAILQIRPSSLIAAGAEMPHISAHCRLHSCRPETAPPPPSAGEPSGSRLSPTSSISVDLLIGCIGNSISFGRLFSNFLPLSLIRYRKWRPRWGRIAWVCIRFEAAALDGKRYLSHGSDRQIRFWATAQPVIRRRPPSSWPTSHPDTHTYSRTVRNYQHFKTNCIKNWPISLCIS